MKPLLFIASLFITSHVHAQGAPAPTGGSGSGKYNLGADLQIGYPFVGLTNPDGTKAYYDGIGMRLNLDIPLLDLTDLDVYLQGGVKYLDLANTASNSGQHESANIIGPGAGIAVRYTKFWFGAQYYQLWARHYSSGGFSGRSNYNFRAIDYFGGFYHTFGRLGVGLIYNASASKIKKESTGLKSDTPYQDSMISIQFTFDTGDSLWHIIRSLF